MVIFNRTLKQETNFDLRPKTTMLLFWMRGPHRRINQEKSPAAETATIANQPDNEGANVLVLGSEI